MAKTTVSAGYIAANAITATELAANSVTAASIASGAILSVDVGANSVTSTAIAANAVNSSEVASNAISTAQIASNAVTAASIATNAVGADQISPNAVKASELASDALSGQNFTGNVTFDTSTLYVDASNDRVGIGTTSPASLLHVVKTSGTDVDIARFSGASSAFNIQCSDLSAATPVWTLRTFSGEILAFGEGLNESGRFDGSGNLLVSKTVTDTLGTAGHELHNSGMVHHTRDSATVLYLNRTTSDGEILNFRKDTTTVGSIAASGGDILIGTGDTAIRFVDADDAIVPFNTSGSGRDNAIDLGKSVERFKDLYLSGTLTNNGTGGLSIDTSGNANFAGDIRLDGGGTIEAPSVGGGENLTLKAAGSVNVYLDSNSNGGDGEYFRILKHTSSELFRVEETGKVGIGAASPTEVLTVSGNVDADDYIGNTSLSNRNIIINGGMDYNQRYGYSTAYALVGVIADYFADRWQIFQGQGAGSLTMSTDVPDGRYRYSFKYDVTTSATAAFLGYRQKIEGYLVQRFAQAGSGAKKIGVGFWIKSNKTGDIQVNIKRSNASRHIGNTLTINSANTWEYKSITFDGDTGGAGDFKGEQLGWEFDIWLDAGGSYVGGSVPTTWQSVADNQRGAGVTLGLCDSTANEVLLTGVQIEAGEPTTFEFLPLSETQARCHRYFYSTFATGQPAQQNNQGGEDWNAMGFRHKFADVIGLRSEYIQWQPGGRMRTTPTRTIYTTTSAGNSGTFYCYSATGATQNIGLNSSGTETHGYWWKYTGMSVGQTGDSVQIIGHYTADSEF